MKHPENRLQDNSQDDPRTRIEAILGAHPVVLFMKGEPAQPMCGFSAATVGVLNSLVSEYETVNVLEDEPIRQGIKEYGNWPTIPQLYIRGELVGGSDVVSEMFNNGQLHELLGLPAPDRTPPEITVTDEAAAILRDAVEAREGVALRLEISTTFQANLSMAPVAGHEIQAETNGLVIYMDLGTAQRANGVTIETVQAPQGVAFRIDNPNAPHQVRAMTVRELQALMESGDSFHLFDVRTTAEREIAVINESQLLDQNSIDTIGQLPEDATLVFYCHTGTRSQAAAERFAAQGFAQVYNVVGGIEAWSQEIDPSVPQY